jgi:ATP-dependent helicase HrpB
MFPPSGLPIDAALPALTAALRAGTSAVLHAPPGAGKSTVVPLALLEEPWVAGRRLILLEPRRLAARAVAQRMAATLGERVGETVGYRMRLETRVSRATRLEVITEGVLTRILQSDPALEGVAGVIFDEFHERSLQADLGLALTLDARLNLSPELRVLVMSATLDVEAVSKLLGDAPVIGAAGKLHPVEIRHLGVGAPLLPGEPRHASRAPRAAGQTPEHVVAHAVQRALAEEHGDVLVFLPGAGEIRRVERLLEEAALGGVRVLPLFGELAPAAQDAALAASHAGERRVVLATNIAETSLTIEGIGVVVDSGLVRRARFDPSSGMGRLETQRISRASAEQRCGRAGRLAPGVCYRIWSAGAHEALAAFTPPEILEADLAPLALELASWGANDAHALRWLDPPPDALIGSARDLLKRLGALDADGRIAAHGREMAELPVHPRLAHMLLKARDLRCAPLAADLSALLSERDLLRGADAGRDADIRTRLEALQGTAARDVVDPGAAQRARRASEQVLRLIRVSGKAAGRAETTDASRVGELLALAYPDRIGRRRPGGEARYALTSGRGAYFAEVQALGREELIVALDLDDRERDARIRLAAPLQRAALERHFSAQLVRSETVEWSSREQAVIARRTVRLDALVLEEQPLPRVPPEAALCEMVRGIRDLGVQSLPWTRETRELQGRIELVRRTLPESAREWPASDDAALLARIDEWLAPWLDGVTRKEQLARIALHDALLARLDYAHQRRLEELAPTHLAMPSGSRIRIDYLDESAPVVAVRLQEVFGLETTPRIAAGRVPVTFRLLSPAQRPVQVTKDLASFWRGAYAEVRKDLRGRYPKHYWPENPLDAAPTRSVKRKR